MFSKQRFPGLCSPPDSNHIHFAISQATELLGRDEPEFERSNSIILHTQKAYKLKRGAQRRDYGQGSR